jgi:hypothetical protein
MNLSSSVGARLQIALTYVIAFCLSSTSPHTIV